MCQTYAHDSCLVMDVSRLPLSLLHWLVVQTPAKQPVQLDREAIAQWSLKEPAKLWCVKRQHGDSSITMGNGSPKHLDASFPEEVGWLTRINSTSDLTVGAGYSLYYTDSAGQQVQRKERTNVCTVCS